METTDPTTLQSISQVLDDPEAFQRWCGYLGIEDVPGFLHAEVPEAQGGPVHQWGQLQSAMRQARRQVNQGDPEAAAHTIAGVLEQPDFKGEGEDARVRAATMVPAVATRKLPPTARNELVLLGGMGGAAAIARRLTKRLRKRITVRMVRDRLRHTNGVRKLGAGYYAVRYHPSVPVARWAESLIEAEGPLEPEVLVNRVMSEYPQGHRRAVNAWIYQDPGRLVVRDGKVHLRTGPAE